MTLRRRGLTCAEIAKTLGLGESTVARYSGAWWQNEGSKKFSRQRKKGETGRSLRNTKTAKVTKAKESPKQSPTPDAVPHLTDEQISYINGIYRSGDLNTGTFIGNLFIRIGKFFGGHYPV
jgi:hypothetical protein